MPVTLFGGMVGEGLAVGAREGGGTGVLVSAASIVSLGSGIFVGSDETGACVVDTGEAEFAGGEPEEMIVDGASQEAVTKTSRIVVLKID